MTEMPNLSDEIDRRIRAWWMGFEHYKRELYDRPKASLLPLKARIIVRSEVVEALLYGCVTWTPLKCHYAKLRTTHHRMLLRVLGAWCKPPNQRILSYKDALQRTQCESIETTVRTKRGGCCGRGRYSAWVTTGYPRGSCRESSRTRGNVDRGGRRKSGRTAWQMIFGYLASLGTGEPPHLTLGRGITRYTKGVVGLWPRG